MTKAEKYWMVSVSILALLMICMAFARAITLRQFKDIATCPTCDGLGVVTTREAPSLESLHWLIETPTNSRAGHITVTIPCCPEVWDNDDRVADVQVADIVTVSEFGLGCMVNTRSRGDVIVTNTFANIYEQLYGREASE